ncbi:MAG: MFS transporter [Chloroflexota bacterium]|nr:MFS transporter [Chloroflexota bacterium]MDE2895331.1 MFS transporter [Chloroflexota bacterium]
MSVPATAPPRYDPARFQRNIRLYYLFMGATGFMLFLPVWIIYLMDARGLSLTEVGVFESFFWLTIIVAEVPTGAIADRFGRRISLALGAILFAISNVIFALAGHFSILLGSYLVMGIAMTLYSGAGDALLFDTLRVLRRTREYEHHAGRSHGLFFAAMVAATAIGGPLAYLVGYTAAILMSAGVFLISAAAALMLREPPRRESDFLPDPLHGTPSEIRNTAADIAQHDSGGVPIFHEMIEGFRIVWRNRPIRFLIPFVAIILALYQMPGFMSQPYVAQHGLDPLAGAVDGFIWSALMLPGYVGTMLGMFGAARLVGKLGERRSFATILLFGGVCLIPLAIWNHLGLLGAIFLVSIAPAAVRPIANGYLNRRITSDQRATVLSILSLVHGVAMSVVMIVFLPAADMISFPASFGLALLTVATLGVGLWLLWHRAHRHDQTDRIRRWSISVPKPQAPRAQAGTTPNGHGGSGAAVYPNVQNLD